MKNFILIILLIPFVGLSQNYIPIRSDSTEWIVENLSIDGDGGDYSYYKIRYFAKGDTLINDSLFIKVFYELNENINFYTYLYQDTLNKKVYYTAYPPGYLRLLFDFNLTEGKEFFTNENNYGFVEKVDSIKINNVFRRRIIFNKGIFVVHNYQQVSLIEGIGSNTGLFPTDYLGLFTSLLTCYKENNETVFPFELNDKGCDLNSIIISNIQNLKISNIQIYPNPFTNKIKVRVGNINTQNLKILVFNLLGEKLLTEEINFGNEFELNLSFLPNGIYTIKIENNELQTFEKMVVKTTY